MKNSIYNIVIYGKNDFFISRAIRAGSEVKSTPPAVNKRVTRASSVEPSGNPNESAGTPRRRRTRVSMVPVEVAVTEEQEEDTNNVSDEVDAEGSLIDCIYR